MCAMVFLVNFGRVAFAPLLDPFMRAFDVGPAAVGLLATLVWLGSALSRIPTGYVLTRLPRDRVVRWTGAFLAVAALLTAVAPDIWLVAVGAFFVGTTSGVYFIAANPLLTELFPGRIGRVLGVHGTASQTAAVVAPLLLGVLVGVSGRWRLAFVALAGLALCVTVAFTLTARRADLPDAGAADRHLLRAVRAQWQIVAVGVLLLGLTGFVWNGLFNFYVVYLTTTRGLSTGTAGTLLTLAFAAGIPSFWVTGRLAERLPHVPLLLAIVAGFVVSLLMLTLASGLPALVAVSAVLGYVIHSSFPAIDVYLLDTLPDEHRASAYSAFSGGMMTMSALGSVALGTVVAAGVTFDAAFRAFAVGLVLVVVSVAALYRAGRVPT